MATPPLTDETLRATVEAYNTNDRNQVRTAAALNYSRGKVQDHLRQAAQRGLMLDHPPAMPGFEISKVTTDPKGGQHVTQKREHGDVFEVPDTHHLGKMTVQRDPEGRVVQDWIRVMPDDAARSAAMRAAVDAFKEEIPRAAPVAAPVARNADLLCQYTVTDVHLGMLAWREETGNSDYDLKIAESLLDRWFATAIELTPNAQTAIFAQLGDLLHHDSHESVTPAHRNVLDADSRFQKMVRAAIRVIRKIVARLLAKHEFVHVVMADANHDPASEAWLRELFAAFYENEPRVTVDSGAGTYYVYRHGDVSLFYHHGHKRGVGNVDTVFAGRFREIYGATKFSYAHLGHKHSDELKTTNLMKVEQHETMAPPDAYAANGGWLSGRSAKVITYHKRRGEVFRSIVSAEMLEEEEAA